jgi:hypothetical protein
LRRISWRKRARVAKSLFADRTAKTMAWSGEIAVLTLCFDSLKILYIPVAPQTIEWKADLHG